eukprot:gb/GFBE01075746.1/.p1 GENE.gb/GFBE01075746.1/~~gb/GFBE01075746.1/.p1  ORF type:complete len:403 (+),score=38.21 gb/GFBE01075746.1/:1-1209(+)
MPNNIMVMGLQGRTSNFVVDDDDFATMTLRDMKQMIRDRTNVPVKEHILIFGNKLLEDDDRLLASYGVRNDSLLRLVCRLRGGLVVIKVRRLVDDSISNIGMEDADFATTTVYQFKERCEDITEVGAETQVLMVADKILVNTRLLTDYNLHHDSTVTLVDRRFTASARRATEACMITLHNDAYEMPRCSHPLSVVGLTALIKRGIAAGEHHVFCPHPDCAQEWIYPEMLKLNMFSVGDMALFEDKLSELVAVQDLHAIPCPHCQSWGCPTLKRQNVVHCCICRSRYCALCGHPWMSSDDNFTCYCGLCEEGCGSVAGTLQILRDSALVRGCLPNVLVPKTRACPHCGSLNEYMGGCKHMVCKCGTHYCQLCIRAHAEHSEEEWNIAFPCPVAPIQTTVPLRR